MDGSLHDRDFYAWTLEQAAALRRLAETRANHDAALDLPHLAEAMEDLGSAQVEKMRSHPLLVLEHLLLIAHAPHSTAVNHRRGDVRVFRRNAARPGRPSMRRLVETGPEGEWHVAAAAGKLGQPLPGLPIPCPFTLDELPDEDLALDQILARLTPDP
ncbi:DUF29 family protein [Dankookia sp. GCM10030260]|uniref:DUF29 family protein n=1 Tax=Dankookia sp. GCM10030260 TaxID=3273390 RepID=UPI0036196D9F